MKKDKRLTCIDLFAGAGGFSLGVAIQEGIDYVKSTWDSTTWMSYKDFSLKMLKEEGLM